MIPCNKCGTRMKARDDGHLVCGSCWRDLEIKPPEPNGWFAVSAYGRVFLLPPEPGGLDGRPLPTDSLSP